MGKHSEQEASERFSEYLAAAEAADAAGDADALPASPGEATWPDLASLALELQRLPVASPSPVFRAQGYSALMQEIQRTPTWRVRVRSFVLSVAGRRPQLAPAWVSLAAALIVCLAAGGVVRAADATVPGDALYGVKTTIEDLRLSVTPAEGDVALHARFAQRRLDELSTLVAAGRYDDAPVAIAGYGEQVNGALSSLTNVGAADQPHRARLALELENALVRQSEALNALAEQMPAALQPVVREAQSDSASARDALKQPAAGGAPAQPSATPEPQREISTPARAVPADVVATSMPEPAASATPTATSEPRVLPGGSLPSGTPPAPRDGSGENPLPAPRKGVRDAPLTPQPPQQPGGGQLPPATPEPGATTPVPRATAELPPATGGSRGPTPASTSPAGTPPAPPAPQGSPQPPGAGWNGSQQPQPVPPQPPASTPSVAGSVPGGSMSPAGPTPAPIAR